jgi:hypothetical protein
VFGAYDVIEPIEALAKHVSVEEQDCGKCLVLSRGAHTALYGQVRKKLRDLGFAHVAGVALPAEEDETTDPPHIRLLRSEAEVSGANGGAHLVEEAGCWDNGGVGLFDAEGIGRSREQTRRALRDHSLSFSREEGGWGVDSTLPSGAIVGAGQRVVEL